MIKRDATTNHSSRCLAATADFRRSPPVIQDIYYRMMGWDPKTGQPTPETLKDLGLEELIPALKTEGFHGK